MIATLLPFSISLVIGVWLAAAAVVLAVLYLLSRHNHEWVRRFDHEERRMFMECALCGKESPGWKIGHSAHDEDAA